MKKGWSVILFIVFGAFLCGAICIGVGYITGADLARITSVLEGSPVYGFVQMLIRYGTQYWDQAVTAVSQFI